MKRNVVWLWPAALSLVILGPLLAPGFVLTYDMVFVPDQAFRRDYLGLGPGLPRAVPSDALVSAMSLVLPGDMLQKLLLLAVFMGAGAGILVLLRGTSAVIQVAAVSWFIWNPYVAERLTIGQWVILVGYAALPWVLAAAVAARQGSRGSAAGLVLALAVAATSASGGLLAALVGLAVLLWRGCRLPQAQRIAVVVGAIAVNAPWLVAGMLHRADLSTNARAVEAFSASGEGRLPTLASVLSLGGIWNIDTVPASRLGWVAVVWLVIGALVIGVGVRPAVRHFGRPVAEAMAFVAVLDVLVALAGTVNGGLVVRLSADVPGLALLRDGTRYLGGLALVEAVVFGFGVARLAKLPRERTVGAIVAAGLVLAPLAVMPDLGWGVGGRLSPVDYPDSWASARDALVGDGGDGRVLVLPDAPYRAYSWNGSTPGVDPAPRYFPNDVLASDALTVDGVAVQGDDSSTAAAASAFESGDADALNRLGVQYIVVDSQPAQLRDQAAALGARSLYSSDDIDVYVLDIATRVTPEARDIVAVAVGCGAWAAALLVALAVRWRGRTRVDRRSAQIK